MTHRHVFGYAIAALIWLAAWGLAFMDHTAGVIACTAIPTAITAMLKGTAR